MPISRIDVDSKNRSLDIFDITYFRNQYQITDSFFDSGSVVIDNPYIELLAQNYDFLRQNSVLVDLDRKYIYRPDYLSFDIYKTVNLWHMLLFVNNCFFIEEFKLEKVYIPTMGAVKQVMRNYIKDDINVVQEE
ncbi:hypothetical protein M0R36_10410 [bacterium]|jgi:hypothetical protein|nr:hypothetical protein [bacterium]